MRNLSQTELYELLIKQTQASIEAARKLIPGVTISAENPYYDEVKDMTKHENGFPGTLKSSSYIDEITLSSGTIQAKPSGKKVMTVLGAWKEDVHLPIDYPHKAAKLSKDGYIQSMGSFDGDLKSEYIINADKVQITSPNQSHYDKIKWVRPADINFLERYLDNPFPYDQVPDIWFEDPPDWLVEAILKQRGGCGCGHPPHRPPCSNCETPWTVDEFVELGVVQPNPKDSWPSYGLKHTCSECVVVGTSGQFCQTLRFSLESDMPAVVKYIEETAEDRLHPSMCATCGQLSCDCLCSAEKVKELPNAFIMARLSGTMGDEE